jgi:multiple sugar transport system substrate-binding protein
MGEKYTCLFFTILFLLSACMQDKGTVVTWAVGKDSTGIQAQLVKNFNASGQGFTVRLVEMPEAAGVQRDSYVTYLVSRDPTIDVYSLDIVWPAEFAAAGWLIPLDERFPPEARSAFLPGPVTACTWNGHIYAVPWFTDAGLLYYRRDLVAAPPMTWRDLVLQAITVRRDRDIAGFVYQGQQYEGLVCNFLEYLWSAGGDLFDRNGRPALNTKAARDALTMMYNMIHRSQIVPRAVLGYQEDDSRQVFTSGNAVFLRNWPYVWAIGQDKTKSKVAGKTGIAPLPHWPGFRSASTLGGWNLGISKYSRHPNEAWRFIRYMTDAQVQKLYAIKGGRLPTLRSVYADPDVLAASPHYRTLYPIFINARPRPSSPIYPRISDLLQVELHRCLTGQKTVDAALQDAQAKLEDLMKEKKLLK